MPLENMEEILRRRRREKDNPRRKRERPVMNFISVLKCVFDLFTNPQVQDCLKNFNSKTIQNLEVNDDEPVVQN